MPNNNLTSNQLLAKDYLEELDFIDISKSDTKDLLLMSKQFTINKSSVEIITEISHNFPLKYPKFYTTDTTMFLKYPHIEQYNHRIRGHRLCLDADEDKLYYENPSDLLYDSYNRLEGFLNKIENNEFDKNEIFDEFDSYWCKTTGIVHFNKELIQKFKSFKVIDSYIIKTEDKELLFIEDEKYIKQFCKSVNYNFIKNKVVYINFERELEKNIPRTYSELKSLILKLGYLSSLQKIKKAKNILPVILFSFRLPGNKETHYAAIYFDEIKSTNVVNFINPFLSDSNSNKVFYGMPAMNISNSRLYKRGGNLMNVNVHKKRKKIAIVGCGSVGATLAHKLVKVGCNNLLLIDPETLSSDNIARHLLGMEYLEQNKAIALKRYLGKQFLDIEISAVDEYVEDVLNDLKDCDLIITALGSDANHIEEKIIRDAINKNSAPVISCWFEATACIGHGILFDSTCDSKVFNINKLFNEIMLLDEKATSMFVKSDVGCNSNYMPYTYLNANLHLNHFANMVTKYLMDEKIKNHWVSVGEIGSLDKYLKSDLKVEDNTLIKRDF
ncbi:hypothetical protein CRV00_05605 [Malaciobacter molluscorum]|nr:hypothetical protein CRV00_05605 [Malaciobacter molluscorum]